MPQFVWQYLVGDFPTCVEEWVSLWGALDKTTLAAVKSALNLRKVCTKFNAAIIDITKFDLFFNADPNSIDIEHIRGTSYKGRSGLDTVAVFKDWNLANLDAILIDAHGETQTIAQSLFNISSTLHGTSLKGKQNWEHNPALANGGLTPESLTQFKSKEITTILRSMKDNHETLGQFKGVSAKIDRIKTAMQQTIRDGDLEDARLFIFWILTYTMMGNIAYVVCSVHLGKSMVAFICRATMSRPAYIRLPASAKVKKLLKKVDLERKRTDQAKRTKEAEKRAKNTKSLAKSLRKRLVKDYSKFYEEDDEGPEEENNNNDETTANIELPDEFYAPIHGGLMLYLFTVVGAFILAGEGNPCRMLRFTDWTNDNHGKMDAKRLTHFFYCLPFIRIIINNTWKDGKVPWARLIKVVPDLKEPTAKQMLGFMGLVRCGEQMKVIFQDFVLSRRMVRLDKFNAAKEALVEMLEEHFILNPTGRSDRVNKFYFSRYQLSALTALMLVFERKMKKAFEMNERIETGEFGDGHSSLPLVLWEAGVVQNSTLENIIGQLRAICHSGNLTGDNLLFAHRRLMAKCLRLRGRLTPGKRRDYEQIKKELIEYRELLEVSETEVCKEVIEELIVSLEKDLAVHYLAEEFKNVVVQ